MLFLRVLILSLSIIISQFGYADTPVGGSRSIWEDPEIQQKFDDLPNHLKPDFIRLIDALDKRLETEEENAKLEKDSEKAKERAEEIEKIREEAKEAVKVSIELGIKTGEKVFKDDVFDLIRPRIFKDKNRLQNKLSLRGLKRFLRLLKATKNARDEHHARERILAKIIQEKLEALTPEELEKFSKLDEEVRKLQIQEWIHNFFEACDLDGCNGDIFDWPIFIDGASKKTLPRVIRIKQHTPFVGPARLAI